jgi:hypothetical protein
MAVRGCQGPDGKPGFCWREDGQAVMTPCRTYTEGDAAGRSAALRLAIRDSGDAMGPVAAETAVPLDG